MVSCRHPDALGALLRRGDTSCRMQEVPTTSLGPIGYLRHKQVRRQRDLSSIWVTRVGVVPVMGIICEELAAQSYFDFPRRFFMDFVYRCDGWEQRCEATSSMTATAGGDKQ